MDDFSGRVPFDPELLNGESHYDPAFPDSQPDFQPEPFDRYPSPLPLASAIRQPSEGLPSLSQRPLSRGLTTQSQPLLSRRPEQPSLSSLRYPSPGPRPTDVPISVSQPSFEGHSSQRPSSR